jgi:6-phosphofructokinase 1
MALASNLLVMQSGGPTPVINRSLFGVYDEASKSRSFLRILGAHRGIEGVLDDRLVDLTGTPGSEWKRIVATPGSALGTTRRKLADDDLPKVIEFIRRRRVTHWFMIGGNDSAETALTVGTAARQAGLDLTVMHVPKTVDNDLVGTDHTPGYGSAARFVAAATQGAGRDAEAMGDAAPVTIIEVAGRDTGWLAQAAALAKREERDAPHVMVVPESAYDESRFLSQIESAYRRHGFAVAVVQENVKGSNDKPLGNRAKPLYADGFGHEYYEGAGRYLTALTAKHLGVRVRYDRPGSIQRSMATLVSSVDAEEAEMVGRAAVRYALDGESEKMVSIVREVGAQYSSTTEVTPLEQVAGAVKPMPANFLDSDGMATDAFIQYARPLIGEPLPEFGRIFA